MPFGQLAEGALLLDEVLCFVLSFSLAFGNAIAFSL
jgi:hypothetical protein